LENLLLVNANLLTFGDKPRNIRRGAVYIGRGTILDFGDEKEMLAKYHNVEIKYDVKGKLVMPGFVDMQNHLYSSFFQNIPLDMSKVKSYSDFHKKYWWNLTDKLSSDGVYYSAVKGIINAMKNGVTTIFNLHSGPSGLADSLNDIAEAFQELSMRGVLAYEITNRRGEAEAEKMFEANCEFISSHSGDPLISGMLGLYNVNSASDELLGKFGRYMKKTGCGLMMHLAESEEDDTISIDKYKKYGIDRLNDHGLLTAKTLLCSTNYVDEYEADILLRSDSSVVLSPSATYYKGLEFAPLEMFLSKKIPSAFGSDGIYASIAQEASFAHKIVRSRMVELNAGNKEIADIVMHSSYKIANKFVSKSIGEIKLGAAADLIVVDYLPENDITADNMHTHLIYGILPARTISTMINGTFVMKDYQIVGIDEQEINAKYMEFAKELN